MTNPLAQLPKAGQSVWYDQTDRRLIATGKLQRMIDEDDLRGMTSNPTIFEKALAEGTAYDEQLAGAPRASRNAAVAPSVAPKRFTTAPPANPKIAPAPSVNASAGMMSTQQTAYTSTYST